VSEINRKAVSPPPPRPMGSEHLHEQFFRAVPLGKDIGLEGTPALKAIAIPVLNSEGNHLIRVTQAGKTYKVFGFSPDQGAK